MREAAGPVLLTHAFVESPQVSVVRAGIETDDVQQSIDAEQSAPRDVRQLVVVDAKIRILDEIF